MFRVIAGGSDIAAVLRQARQSDMYAYESSVKQQRIFQLQTELDSAKSSLRVQTKAREDVDAEKTTLQAQFTSERTDLRTRCRELESELNSLRSAQHLQSAARDQDATVINRLECEKSFMQACIDQLQADIDTAEAAVCAEKQSSEALAAEKTSLQAQLAEVTEKRDQLLSTQSAQREKVSSLEGRLLAVKSEALDAQDALEHRVLAVKSEKLDADEAAATARREAAAATEHKRKLGKECEQQRKKLRATEGQLEQKEEEIQRMENQLEQAASEASCTSGVCDNTRKVGYVPCGHVPFCRACDEKHQGGPERSKLTSLLRTCPICRRKIQRIVVLYL